MTYLNNRHYSAEMGVFVSVDPIVRKTGQPYLYGNANPIRFSDPSGLEPRPTHNRNRDWKQKPPTRSDYQSGCGGYGCASGGGRSGGGSSSSSRGGSSNAASAINFTANEIVSNAGDSATQHIRDIRKPSRSRVLMWGATLGFGFIADSNQAGVSLGTFAARFRSGGDWDIKRSLAGYFLLVAGGSEWGVRNDVFGNIHFGAVMNEAGITEFEARRIANVGEEVRVCNSGGCERPLEPLVGRNSPADDYALAIGYRVGRPGSVEEAQARIFTELGAGIEGLYRASNDRVSPDRAVLCLGGICAGD